MKVQAFFFFASLLPQRSGGFMKKGKKLIQNQRGQGLIEYLIIVALIAVSAIAVVRVVGANVSVQFANIAKALGSGDDYQIQAKKVEESLYSKKDLSNFMKGSGSGKGSDSK